MDFGYKTLVLFTFQKESNWVMEHLYEEIECREVVEINFYLQRLPVELLHTRYLVRKWNLHNSSNNQQSNEDIQVYPGNDSNIPLKGLILILVYFNFQLFKFYFSLSSVTLSNRYYIFICICSTGWPPLL